MRRVRLVILLVGLVTICYLGVVALFPAAGDPVGLDLGPELHPVTKRFGESLVLLAFGAGCGFFTWVLGKDLRKYWVMNLRGITVPGTVRTLDIVGKGAEEAPDFWARVDLVTADGRAVDVLVRGSSFDKLSVDKAVKVRYDPKAVLPPRFTNWRPVSVVLGAFLGGWMYYLFLAGVVASVALTVAAIVHLFTGN